MHCKNTKKVYLNEYPLLLGVFQLSHYILSLLDCPERA